MKSKDLKLKTLDLADDMMATIDSLGEIEDQMKVVSFALTFWQERAENLINYARAKGEIKLLAKKGLEKQSAVLRERINQEK
jgi:hypothetical protein